MKNACTFSTPGSVLCEELDILMQVLVYRWVEIKLWNVGGYFLLILYMQMHILGSTSKIQYSYSINKICHRIFFKSLIKLYQDSPISADIN